MHCERTSPLTLPPRAAMPQPSPSPSPNRKVDKRKSEIANKINLYLALDFDRLPRLSMDIEDNEEVEIEIINKNNWLMIDLSFAYVVALANELGYYDGLE